MFASRTKMVASSNSLYQVTVSDVMYLGCYFAVGVVATVAVVIAVFVVVVVLFVVVVDMRLNK